AYMCGFAYAAALCIYQIGSAINGQVNVLGLIAALAVIAYALYMLFRPYKESETLTQTVKVK
ncbi:MAG: hypothetical protein IKS54_02380, partial [Erysipelotrichaceae bacterium]|nr:hypothetical protein [Erysipelotrichaceae bacterium]